MNELMREMLVLPEQASSVSADVDFLHYFVIGVTTLGAFGVAAMVLYFLIRYRRRHGDASRPPAENGAGSAARRFEAAAVVGLLTLFLLWWVLGMRQYSELKTPPRRSLDVYVVAKQWMWSFAYPDGRGSEDVLYVPVGRPIRLIMTSRDVIHSFYVPAFRIKQDVVPGRTTTTWFEAERPGRYEVLCAEYCGVKHSFMRAAVVAMAPADYAGYLDGAQPDLEPLAARGRDVAAEKGCLRCHTLDGTAHIGPTWAGLFGSEVRLADGTRVRAEAGYLTESMMDPTAKIVTGFKPVMPSYLGQLTPAETGAVVELIRSLREVPPEPQPGPTFERAP